MRRLRINATVFASILVISNLCITKIDAQNLDNSFFTKPDRPVETRWYSPENRDGKPGAGGQANYGRKGSPNAVIKPGETFVVADIKGSGVIRRIWATTDPFDDPIFLRSLKFEIFWDGESKPAVQVPMGDFFCHTFGKMTRFENVFFSCPEAQSYNCYIPMPFRKSAKIVLTNEGDRIMRLFYEIDCTMNEIHGPDMLYFHANWRRENYTKAREDFTILPEIKGSGRFLGCNIGMRQNPAMTSFWFGEGEFQVFLDGDTDWPTLCGTGTEDFIGTGWGQDHFDDLYQGCHYVSEEKKGLFNDFYGFYRFHVPDPIYFDKDIKVKIQVLGGAMLKAGLLKDMESNPSVRYMKAGKPGEHWSVEEIKGIEEEFFVLVEREDDYCATAYWYLDSPKNDLSPLAPLAERIADLP